MDRKKFLIAGVCFVSAVALVVVGKSMSKLSDRVMSEDEYSI